MRRRQAGGNRAVPPGGSGDPGSGKGPGILYLVATPIGNLDDITLRALDLLRRVDWVAAEDTRRTSILLRRHGIDRSTLSCHAHNEHQRIPQLVSRLRRGEDGLVVTDAGTPAISDPGFLLAREARTAGIRVEVIPGPSAVLTALLSSGLPCERFTFLGYPPAKGAARRRFLKAALREERTTVLFEAPHRIVRCLGEIAEEDPDRDLAVCRELTKRFEEILRGRADELHRKLLERPRRGEFTLVIAAAPEEENG